MPRRDAANEALSSLKRFGEVRRYSNAQEMPTSGYYVYVVYNGQDVLQLGKGNADRMRKCVRGGLAGKHNKAFVCAIGEVALGSPNSYAAIKADDAETAATWKGSFIEI